MFQKQFVIKDWDEGIPIDLYHLVQRITAEREASCLDGLEREPLPGIEIHPDFLSVVVTSPEIDNRVSFRDVLKLRFAESASKKTNSKFLRESTNHVDKLDMHNMLQILSSISEWSLFIALILLPLARSLHRLHRAGIFLGACMRPENIWMYCGSQSSSSHPHVVVHYDCIDFRETAEVNLSYQAPELLLGLDPAHTDGSADIWSLGIILMEFLIRRHLFEPSGQRQNALRCVYSFHILQRQHTPNKIYNTSEDHLEQQPRVHGEDLAAQLEKLVVLSNGFNPIALKEVQGSGSTYLESLISCSGFSVPVDQPASYSWFRTIVTKMLLLDPSLRPTVDQLLESVPDD